METTAQSAKCTHLVPLWNVEELYNIYIYGSLVCDKALEATQYATCIAEVMPAAVPIAYTE